MTTIKHTWTSYGTLTEVIPSASLNSLANTAAALGSEIDNTTGKELYIKFELYLASVDLSAKVNPKAELYLIESLDGTNYADASILVSKQITSIEVDVTNAAHREVSNICEVPPGKFKINIRNYTGAAFATSGNTLKYRLFSRESN